MPKEAAERAVGAAEETAEGSLVDQIMRETKMTPSEEGYDTASGKTSAPVRSSSLP